MISVITVNKNNAEGLKATIESVASQSYPHVDFIVVDGDSGDGSKEVLNRYKSKISTCICEPDTGIYQAMNKGIKAAKGDYLLFLNSGDWFLNKDVLKNVAGHLHDHDVICGDIVIEDPQGTKHCISSNDDIEIDFFLERSLYHQVTFISKQAFEKYGLYNEQFKLCGDYEFFIRILFRYNATYRHVPAQVSYFRADGISNNTDFNELKKQEAAMAWQMNVSDRVLKHLRENEKFLTSTVYWIYHKTRVSGLYKAVFSFIFAVREKIFVLLKKKKSG